MSADAGTTHATRSLLVCRVGDRVCGLPLDHVVETMRPRSVEPIAGGPSFVKGVALVRGETVPVVDGCGLLGTSARAGRLVTIDVGDRRVALEVEDVIGVRDIDESTLDPLPPLVAEMDPDVVAALGRLDDQLLVVLDDTKLVSDDLVDVGGVAVER